jgi:phosphonate metabolism-associated iron-containing alcohol dehydrogenase
MNSNFMTRMPVQVHCGPGLIRQLARIVPERPVIVLVHPNADSGEAAGLIREALADRCIATLSHADGLPTLAEAVRLCREIWPLIDQASEAPDARPILLAFGGGATIDLAKAVCHRPADRDPAALSAWIRGQGERPTLDPIELIALPTTAGTGSEVTCWATLWDLDADQAQDIERRGIKRSLESPAGYPMLAVIDPEATLTCPDSLTRDSGLDALSHALEAIWNRHANPVSDALATASAKRILDVLPRLLAQPASLDLRAAMSEAALMAGLAFSQTRTALAHALSYPLTVEQGIPHGLACAIWLPTACSLATGRNPERDALLRSIFPAAEVPATALAQWLTPMGVPPPESVIAATEIGSRIAAALAHPRGRNFIGAH